MDTEYRCWRITGSFDWSMEGCPSGQLDRCKSHHVGEVCMTGQTVRL